MCEKTTGTRRMLSDKHTEIKVGLFRLQEKTLQMSGEYEFQSKHETHIRSSIITEVATAHLAEHDLLYSFTVSTISLSVWKRKRCLWAQSKYFPTEMLSFLSTCTQLWASLWSVSESQYPKLVGKSSREIVPAFCHAKTENFMQITVTSSKSITFLVRCDSQRIRLFYWIRVFYYSDCWFGLVI